MKEFKIATSNAKRMHDLEKEINRLAKEGFEVCSPISSVFHPFERKENEHSWAEYEAWTELMVVVSREVVEEKAKEIDLGDFSAALTRIEEGTRSFRGEF